MAMMMRLLLAREAGSPGRQVQAGQVAGPSPRAGGGG